MAKKTTAAVIDLELGKERVIKFKNSTPSRPTTKKKDAVFSEVLIQEENEHEEQQSPTEPKRQFRFAIVNNKTRAGVILPATINKEHSHIFVKIPPLQDVFSAGSNYSAQLEALTESEEKKSIVEVISTASINFSDSQEMFEIEEVLLGNREEAVEEQQQFTNSQIAAQPTLKKQPAPLKFKIQLV